MIRSAVAGNGAWRTWCRARSSSAAIGFLVIILVAIIDYRFWSGAIVPMYVVIVSPCCCYSSWGTPASAPRAGSRPGLVSIQPTELAKIVIILALANFFDRNIDNSQTWGWLLKGFLITVVIAGLIFIQPNLSNVIVIMVMWAAMSGWRAGAEEVWHLSGLGLSAHRSSF